MGEIGDLIAILGAIDRAASDDQGYERCNEVARLVKAIARAALIYQHASLDRARAIGGGRPSTRRGQSSDVERGTRGHGGANLQPNRLGLRSDESAPDLRPGRWERVTGIEPALSAWEADVLPLNYTRGVRRRG
jgi:hypothetical protein